MSYKLKDIFIEEVSKNDNLLKEGFWDTIKSGFTSGIKNLMKLATSTPEERNAMVQAKQAQQVLKYLKKAQSFGIKRISGHDINKIIADLEKATQVLKSNEEQGNAQLMSLLQGLGQKPAGKRSNPRKGRMMRREAKYSLKEIFTEQVNPDPDENEIQNEFETDYTNNDAPDRAPGESIVQNAADKAPILSDEEVLSGLRDDVANYGEYDPALENEK